MLGLAAYEMLAKVPAEADLWDSGRVASQQSLNVLYAGSALQPSTRYYWRVTVWDAAGKPYPSSPASWWETGLLSQSNWRAAWIGYETAEEDAVRHAPAAWIANPDAKALAVEKLPEQHFAFRKIVTLDKPIRRRGALCHRPGYSVGVGKTDRKCSRPIRCLLMARCRGRSCAFGRESSWLPAPTPLPLSWCITCEPQRYGH